MNLGPFWYFKFDYQLSATTILGDSKREGKNKQHQNIYQSPMPNHCTNCFHTRMVLNFTNKPATSRKLYVWIIIFLIRQRKKNIICFTFLQRQAFDHCCSSAARQMEKGATYEYHAWLFQFSGLFTSVRWELLSAEIRDSYVFINLTLPRATE